MSAVRRPRSTPGTPLRIGIWLLIAAATSGALFACASRQSTKSDVSAAKARAETGYNPEHRFQTAATQDTWLIGSDPVDIRLLVPIQSGSYPLILYLPGLGESPDAGLAWRQHWAEAGYAVLSAQPARYGIAVWSSDRAHVGDFLDIAKDAFAAPSLATRTEFARGLLDETWRRYHGTRDAALTRVDLSRIAVAGYDLGAQTAMMVAGEKVEGVESLHMPDGVKCVVALSPYADFSGMGLESNFSSIRLPVLSVTSAQDTDAYGLVKSAAVRRAPYQYMPASQKYLLILSGAPHSLFAGAMPPTNGKGGNYSQSSSEGEAEAEAEAVPLGDDASAHTQGHGRNSRRGSSGPASGTSSARRAIEVVQVQSVTTAFLDATVKNDPIGWEWLSKNAKHWLGGNADLESK